ncbi:unnamed protein product [Anisakis simplex]|uniref:Homeobox protein Nkx-3.1 (inferred by orthology to a human protein) n=1 Tax=Anisakis simplex TaxID=6269 RepID=A0A0M3JVJ2_ANISI|nr:unnamed protein product [Anisakis simplex]
MKMINDGGDLVIMVVENDRMKPNDDVFSVQERTGGLSYGRKRRRSSFSAEQVCRLEVEFQRQRYLSADTRNRLALALGLSQQQVVFGLAQHRVKIWFQNRRYKSKLKEQARENATQNENVASENENGGNLTRPVVVLVRDGCPTFEYFVTTFKYTTNDSE